MEELPPAGRWPLGPAPSGPLPPARSLVWHAWRRRLCAAIHASPADIPTPTALWRLLHDGAPPPRGATWEDALAGASTQRIQDGIRRARAPGAGDAVTWNLRWLTDPRTARARAKRELLLQLADQGSVVLLQETHWDGEAAATWGSGLLPHTELAHSLARPGPNGGPQGGVAIVCPGPRRVVGQRVLVPGCAVEATVAGPAGERTVTYVSIYLPPGCQAEIIVALGVVSPSPLLALV